MAVDQPANQEFLRDEDGEEFDEIDAKAEKIDEADADAEEHDGALVVDPGVNVCCPCSSCGCSYSFQCYDRACACCSHIQ